MIPAKDEARRIAATVRAVRAIPGVDLVLVVDDGSVDDTQHAAREAGAVVVRHSHNRGRAAAFETGAAVVAMRDVPGRPPRSLLLLAADLAEAAVNVAPLVAPVLAGDVDMTVALLPPASTGRGLVVRAARRAIAQLTGWTPGAPLSPLRCLTRAAFEAATPLAHGAGVEPAMTIDLLRAGFRVLEVPIELRHHPGGGTLHNQAQRVSGARDVELAISARRARAAADAVRDRLAPRPSHTS
ncbi:MAG TPA: glycosyltransferase [Cellulomonas sp.]